MPLTDLDELLLTVRNRNSRSYIAEAIDTYRTRSYRSAIMSTWIATAYDIISKIRELAGQGEAVAINFATNLDNAIEAYERNDPQATKRLQEIENDLMNKAEIDFEFLTHQQRRDLDRLKEDRNLCAHPAFTSQELLFQPSAEQVRTHIVHAIEYLLQQPPIQGRSALLRLKQDILQPSFPSSQDAVDAFLDRKYFEHSKESLRVSTLTVLLKLIIRRDDADLAAKGASIFRCFVAFRQKFTALYRTQMPELLRRLTDDSTDEQLVRVIPILALDREAWGWLSGHSQIRLRELAGGIRIDSADLESLIMAVRVPELKQTIVDAVNELEEEEKISVISRSPQPEFCEEAIQILSGVGSWRKAERVLENVVLPLAESYTADQVAQICTIVHENYDVRTARGTPGLLRAFIASTLERLPRTSVCWLQLYGELERRDALGNVLVSELRSHGYEPPVAEQAEEEEPEEEDDEDDEE